MPTAWQAMLPHDQSGHCRLCHQHLLCGCHIIDITYIYIHIYLYIHIHVYEYGTIVYASKAGMGVP